MQSRVIVAAILLSCSAVPARDAISQSDNYRENLSFNKDRSKDTLQRRSKTRVRFQQFNVEDGLSQGTIRCIVQDHKGFIWIGTNDGLNRFDGIEFKIFRHDPENRCSLSSNVVTCLHEDRDGVLWVGTDRGLNGYDRIREDFT